MRALLRPAPLLTRCAQLGPAASHESAPVPCNASLGVGCPAIASHRAPSRAPLSAPAVVDPSHRHPPPAAVAPAVVDPSHRHAVRPRRCRLRPTAIRPRGRRCVPPNVGAAPTPADSAPVLLPLLLSLLAAGSSSEGIVESSSEPPDTDCSSSSASSRSPRTPTSRYQGTEVPCLGETAGPLEQSDSFRRIAAASPNWRPRQF